MEITSTQNNKFKNLLKMKSKKNRDISNTFLVEGTKEIDFAIKNSFVCIEIWGTWDKIGNYLDNINKYSITKEMFEKIGYRESTESIIAIFQKKEFKKSIKDCKSVLVCEQIEKPGNLGAIFRIADGASVDLIIFNDQEADIYNPNVIRNSTGTFFSVPFIFESSEKTLEELKKNDIKLITATPEATKTYYNENLTTKIALIVGNEHSGVSEFWKINADSLIAIPMKGQNDSLNVGVSVAIILYERIRQLSL
jgi:RNA methyltransferase, TrmH family